MHVWEWGTRVPQSRFGLMCGRKHLGNPNQSSACPNELLTTVNLTSHREHLNRNYRALLVMLPGSKSHRNLWALCSILPLQDTSEFVVRCGALWSARSYSSQFRDVKLEVKVAAFTKHWLCSINTNLYLRHSHLHGHAPGVAQREVFAVIIERMTVRAVFRRRGQGYSSCLVKQIFRRASEKDLIMEGQILCRLLHINRTLVWLQQVSNLKWARGN
jgi:hypothetical protein